MKLRQRGQPDADGPLDELLDEPGQSDPPATDDGPLASSWTGGPALATRGASALLWSALLAGPAALLLAVNGALSSPPPPARLVRPVIDRVPEQTAAAEFSSRLVTRWLTSSRGQESELAPWVRGGQLALPQTAWTVGPATVASQRWLQDGIWMVVTAVPVAPDPSTASSSSAWPVRYFQVPVHLDAAGPVALALPAPVAGPGIASAPPRLDYRYRVAPDDPIGLSTAQFLAALLAGTGDVTRYLSPGTSIAPLTPAPYTAVRVTDLASDRELTAGAPAPADGTRLRLLVTASVSQDPQHQTAVQYPLSLTVRGGRWEITAIDPAPAVLPTVLTGTAGPARPGLSPAVTPDASPAPAARTASPLNIPPGPTAIPVLPSTPSSPDPLLD